MNFEELKFMILGGSCVGLPIAKPYRTPGPVDNVSIGPKGLINVKNLIEGKILEDIENQRFRIVSRGEYKTVYQCEESGYEIFHNDPTTLKYLEEFRKRYNNFQNALERINEPDQYILYFLTKQDVDPTLTKLNETFYEGLEYLKEKMPLQKIIIVIPFADESHYCYSDYADLKNLIWPEDLKIKHLRIPYNNPYKNKYFKEGAEQLIFPREDRKKNINIANKLIKDSTSFLDWLNTIDFSFKEKLSKEERLLILRHYDKLTFESLKKKEEFTKEFENYLKEHTPEDSIDITLSFVDPLMKSWRKKYFDCCEKENKPRSIDFARYDDFQGLLIYAIRSIASYVNTNGILHLIVQDISQVPDWIDQDNVRIVVHESFIPKAFLPTFNSSTIGLFLYRIVGLSEKFLIMNDDQVFRNSVNLETFFENNKSRLDYNLIWRPSVSENWFYPTCTNSYNLIFQHVGENIFTKDALNLRVPCTDHAVYGYKRSSCKEVFETYKNVLWYSITPFREKNNINEYIYFWDMIAKKCFEPNNQKYLYMGLYDTSTFEEILQIFKYLERGYALDINRKIQLFNLNTPHHGVMEKCLKILEKTFPEKCIFEKKVMYE